MRSPSQLDSTFLLTFSSGPNPSGPPSPGDFTVLVDPWLDGDSFIFHPKFALAKHTIRPCIRHLSEIPTPNVVVISQDKSDHCHKETLCQLDADLAHTVILAPPAAAKRIRSWKYFDCSNVHAFPTFSDKKPDTIVRFRIPCPIRGYASAEATLSFIPTKRDITGLHNAVGITYRPPFLENPITPPLSSPAWSIGHNQSVSDLTLPPQGGRMGGTMPPTPPESPSLFDDSSGEPSLSPVLDYQALARNEEAPLSPDLWRPQSRRTDPDSSPSQQGSEPPQHCSLAASRNLTALTPNVRTANPQRNRSNSRQNQPSSPTASQHSRSSSQNFSRPFSHQRVPSNPTPSTCPSTSAPTSYPSFSYPPTLYPPNSYPPISYPPPSYLPTSYPPQHHQQQTAPSTPSLLTYNPHRPKTLSVIYAPHGVTYSAIRSYATSHLVRSAALPLTCLLHSFDRVQNAWYLGGTINAGMPGGLEVARGLMARCWISAHDEDKESSGWSVRTVVTKRYSAKQVRGLLEREEGGRASGAMCDVRSLESGEEFVLSGHGVLEGKGAVCRDVGMDRFVDGDGG